MFQLWPLSNARVKLSSVALSMTVLDQFYFLSTLFTNIWPNFEAPFLILVRNVWKKKLKSIFDLAHIWLHRKLFGLFSTLHSSSVSLSFLRTSWAVSGQGIWHLQPEHKHKFILKKTKKLFFRQIAISTYIFIINIQIKRENQVWNKNEKFVKLRNVNDHLDESDCFDNFCFVQTQSVANCTIYFCTWTRPERPISIAFFVKSVINSKTKSSRNSTVSV